MKTTIIAVILSLAAIIGTCYTIVNVREQSVLKLEAEARKAEAEQRKAVAKEKAENAAKAKAQSEKDAEKHKADAARDERVAAEKQKQAAEENKKAAELKESIARTEARKAADEARKSTADAKAAADRRAAAEAIAAQAMATNETRLAELRIAENARLAVEADIRRTEAENKANELKKLDLDRRLAEVAELQETLRQREETTRPDRSISDIISENDRRRAEAEAAAAAEEERRLAELAAKDHAAYEAEMERRRKINRYGVAAPKSKPLSAAEKLVKNAQDELDRTTEEGSAAVRKSITARLEREMRQALEEGRMEDADFYFRNLRLLVPGYRANGIAK